MSEPLILRARIDASIEDVWRALTDARALRGVLPAGHRPVRAGKRRQ